MSYCFVRNEKVTPEAAEKAKVDISAQISMLMCSTSNPYYSHAREKFNSPNLKN